MRYAALLASFAVAAGAVQAGEAQNVSDIRAAIGLIASKQAAAKAEGRPIATGRLEVTWDYGAACSDAASFIPPPLEGWGIANDLPLGEWPVGPDIARISYSTADDGASRQVAAIYVASSPAQVQGLEQFLAMPAMRSVMFEDGPYGYPVQKRAMTTLAGPYIIQVTARGADAGQYFDAMIACAIRSKMIAKGVDPESLETPP